MSARRIAVHKPPSRNRVPRRRCNDRRVDRGWYLLRLASLDTDLYHYVRVILLIFVHTNLETSPTLSTRIRPASVAKGHGTGGTLVIMTAAIGMPVHLLAGCIKREHMLLPTGALPLLPMGLSIQPVADV